MIDRVTEKLGRKLYEVPVGFKWFVDGLLDGSLGFGGEESAGASFLRRDGTVWTTDKDGIVPALLAAEITARTGRDPGEIYGDLTREFGEPVYDRVEAPATAEQKKRLAALSPQAGAMRRAGRRKGPEHRQRGSGKPRADRRGEGHCRERLVRRAAVGHRGHLQDLRRELSRAEPPASHRRGGAGGRRCGAWRGSGRDAAFEDVANTPDGPGARKRDA